ncbi:MAG: PaaI family thioesterase [Pseudomonadota bacterium]
MSDGLSADQIRAFLSDPDQAPPATKFLGVEIVDIDVEGARIEIRSQGRPELCNPNGSVQGGIVSAYLDEAMSLALLIGLRFSAAVPTLEMKTSYLRPLIEGPFRFEGSVTRAGKSVGFTEGRAYDAKGRLCAIATATAAIKRGDPSA